MVRTLGFRSKAQEQEGRGESTATTTLFALDKRPNHVTAGEFWDSLRPTAEDIDNAQSIIEWAQSLAETPDLSNYLNDLRVAVSLGYVDSKRAGLVASAVAAFGRVQAEIALANQPQTVSKHVGIVGKRQNFSDLTVTRVAYSENMYGTKTILVMKDKEGNVLTWFASGYKKYDIGAILQGKCTVKEHGEYKGVAQTILSRCTFE